MPDRFTKMLYAPLGWIPTPHIRNLMIKNFIVIGVIGFILGIIITPVYVSYVNEGRELYRTVVHNKPADATNASWASIEFIITNVDILTNGNIRARINLLPQNTTTESLVDSHNLNAYNMDLYINSVPVSFIKGREPYGFDQLFPLFGGDMNSYPTDAYKAQISFKLVNKDLSNKTVPISISFVGSLQTYKFASVVTAPYDHEPDWLRLSVSVGRSSTTIGFSVFVQILLWLLSVMILFISVDMVVREREVQAPLLAFNIAMLFALPALRNSQPGIPNFGVSADVIGFFWNMVLIALAQLIMAYRWVVQFKGKAPEPPKPAPPPVADDQIPLVEMPSEPTLTIKN